MGDNIRLKGPLGIKQDIYNDKRAKEFKRIFQLTPKEIIAEYDKKLLEEKKQEKNGGAIKVKKAVFGSLIKNMLSGKETKTEDSAAPFRQTFNVKDSETGETKNIMQDFKPAQSQNNFSNDTGLLSRLFGAIKNKPSTSVGPLKHDFYVKDKAGQNVNISEKKKGGLVDLTKDKKYWKGRL
jgi:RecB family endonuclease NucS